MARYNLSQIQGLLRQAGWPENLIAKYGAIVMYESGGNVKAYNGNGEDSYGLLQIYLKYHPTFDTSRAADPIYNLSYAYDIYKREGDHAWITSVGKYNRNFQGIAEQSRAIYSAGGNTTVIDADTANNLIDAAPGASSVGTQAMVYVALAGFGALWFFSRR